MNVSTGSKIVCALAILTLAGLALADGINATTSPSTTTAPYVPHVAVVPPGLHQITVGDYSIFCLPEDDAWVKPGAAAAKPASRPSTMPSDLVASLKQHHDEIVTQIT